MGGMMTIHDISRASGSLARIWVLAAFFTLAAWAQDDNTVLAVPVSQLGAFWIPDHMEAARYPLNAGRKREEGCATIGFIIEADGTTSSHQVVTSWPDSKFANPSLDAARQFTYRPAPDNPRHEAVYTTYTFTFLLDRTERDSTDAQDALTRVCLAQVGRAG